MRIPVVFPCFESVHPVSFNGFAASSLRQLGQLFGEDSGLPALCTDGREGKGALAEGRGHGAAVTMNYDEFLVPKSA